MIGIAAIVGTLLWASDEFGALQAVFTVLAFIAALGAFFATWPEYRMIVAQPRIRLWVEISQDRSLPAEPVGDRAYIARDAFVVKVAIVNEAKEGTMRNAVLNIIVPAVCDIEVLDAPGKTQYRSALPSLDPKISPDGETRQAANWTVARDDITPGEHAFHVEVRPLRPTKGPWIVFVDLTGDPPPAAEQRTRRIEVFRAK